MQSISGTPLVIAITMFLLMISSFVVIFIIVYQNRYHKYLQEKEALKQELLRTQLEIQEETMQTISQEIHDNIGQILSLCKLHLSNMALDEANPVHEKILTTKELLSQAIVDLRDLSKTLNSEYIANESVIDLLQTQLGYIKKAGTHISEFSVDGNETAIDPSRQIILFRMVQESLQNIFKHAEAKTIKIRLNYQPQHLQLLIADDGKGFDTKGYKSGNGIYNMIYKAKLIGAAYNIMSEPHKGTQVEITVPLLLNQPTHGKN